MIRSAPLSRQFCGPFTACHHAGISPFSFLLTDRCMQAYHSSFLNETDVREAGSIALLPFNTRFRGPVYPPSNSESPGTPQQHRYPFANSADIIEECLTLFRANCLFRNFEIKGAADRTLIYGILFISDCLNKLGTRVSQNQQEATKTLNALALENFNIPGEPGFPLNPLYPAPASRQDAGISPRFG